MLNAENVPAGSYSTIKKRMHILFQNKTSLKEEKVAVAEDDLLPLALNSVLLHYILQKLDLEQTELTK